MPGSFPQHLRIAPSFSKSTYNKFYRDEIEVRKQFDYPPFGEILMIISEKKIEGVTYDGVDLEDFASDLRCIYSKWSLNTNSLCQFFQAGFAKRSPVAKFMGRYYRSFL